MDNIPASEYFAFVYAELKDSKRDRYKVSSSKRHCSWLGVNKFWSKLWSCVCVFLHCCDSKSKQRWVPI